ncbi:serine/threonine-protein kinase [Clostridium sp. E02]|uniref:serine/threonine protein kinase n=1 Tax=Clostridium sp. E02 TaxID=2487134 RepID=UPI000F5434BD|nr:serine/threonine-protein kinase [Clostridium sp. E02]
MIVCRHKEAIEVSTVLFGKYQLCGILGTGQEGCVYLSVHLGLEEYRAIKRVPKSFLNYEQFRREALVLKELRHPGIPIVYDVEEDESYSYLIEEYLEGESLYDLVKSQGHLSRELTIFYGIQLASIISYLHLAGSNPILHLDLQPKNLLLCQCQLKLVDFGLAGSIDQANMPGDRYGTVGCAAPEQYLKDGILDERTDIYAIGSILHYLYTGRFPTLPFQPDSSMNKDLAAVIRTCVQEEKEERFSSANELLERLNQLKNAEMAAKTRLTASSLTIALIGSKSGAGTTHMGIALSIFLKNHGSPNLFVEKQDTGLGAGRFDAAKGKRDQYGLMRYRGLVLKPYYGPGVKLKDPPFSLRILDCGKNMELAVRSDPDGIILICDGSVWNRKNSIDAIHSMKKNKITHVVVFNHLGKELRLPREFSSSLFFRAPYFKDPFSPGTEVQSFYKVLLEELLKDQTLKPKTIKGRIRQIFERKKES